MKILFVSKASAVGGRAGHAELEDGQLSIDIAMPGTGRKGVSPEQLFALGYAACFDSAVNHVARMKKIPLGSSKTIAAVGLGQTEAGGYALDIDLDVEISGLSETDAHSLVEAAHQVCPYSNATRNNVDVRLHVRIV
jgi:lipoyl-dependent peroxiredoxin